MQRDKAPQFTQSDHCDDRDPPPERSAGTGTVKIDLPQVAATNPAATILLSAQEAYEQRNMTRALQLTNQAINNNGGAAAYRAPFTDP